METKAEISEPRLLGVCTIYDIAINGEKVLSVVQDKSEGMVDILPLSAECSDGMIDFAQSLLPVCPSAPRPTLSTPTPCLTSEPRPLRQASTIGTDYTKLLLSDPSTA